MDLRNATQSRLAEVGMSLFALLWGAWLCLPMGSFAQSAGGHGFIALIPYEWAWGLNAICIGLAQAATLRYPRYVPLTSLGAMAWWSFVAYVFTQAGAAIPGIPAYVAVAVINFLIFLCQDQPIVLPTTRRA